MKLFFKHRLIDPLLGLLKQGITPEKLAVSAVLGFILGIFPVLGSTMILCAAASYIFRLNIAAIQTVNYLVYPLQLLFFIPFIRIGEFILNSEPFPISMEKIFSLLQQDIVLAVRTFWTANLHGIFAWAVICPLTAFAAYFPVRYVFVKAGEKIKEKSNG